MRCAWDGSDCRRCVSHCQLDHEYQRASLDPRASPRQREAALRERVVELERALAKRSRAEAEAIRVAADWLGRASAEDAEWHGGVLALSRGLQALCRAPDLPREHQALLACLARDAIALQRQLNHLRTAFAADVSGPRAVVRGQATHEGRSR